MTANDEAGESGRGQIMDGLNDLSGRFFFF